MMHLPVEGGQSDGLVECVRSWERLGASYALLWTAQWAGDGCWSSPAEMNQRGKVNKMQLAVEILN